ncbi:MAG: aminotransferase class I/II-fold pyridoxal phosphate-dependent enzyme [Oscillospiraceae bacterium]|nr:aminotransferase class I/II-fold pyridoxal phosphate-dependent enzyme [Oscillospiraceae bacterium]
MKTPVVDFVKRYACGGFLRLHMPGHKGKGFIGVEQNDITEIDGADVLYNSQGIIRRSEENAAKLFKTSRTVYSAEGSSLCIRAMLYLVKTYGEAQGKKPIIAAGRNAHKTFVSAAALLDIEVEWLLPENTESVISCKIDADFLENYLCGCKEKPIAVYVTSPDYLGTVLDINALSEVCRKYGVLLLVDNAHGAYLAFLEKSCHPIAQGADICCDSAHKTLPVLTGGAYMHISDSAPTFFAEHSEVAMDVFASTSPSYLILQSLDAANKYLAQDYPKRLSDFVKEVEALKTEVKEMGYCLVGDEPLKLTVASKAFGYTGTELAQKLLEKKIVCEFSDPDFAVMMLTLETGAEGLEKLKAALASIKKRKAIDATPPTPVISKKVLSLKEALFSPSKRMSIEKCEGRVLATVSVACPPAVPVILCGEQIDSKAIECFKYYGIQECFVVDN